MNETAREDGYWYTPYGGEREWRTMPSCSECGGEYEQRQVKPMEEAAEGEAVADVVCGSCGYHLVSFSRPTQAAIDRGRELAKKYGW